MNVAFYLIFLTSSVGAAFYEAPKNHSVLLGDDVTFRCSAEKTTDSLIYSQWKSNTGSLLGFHQGGQLPGHQGRYSYIKELPEELHLRIEKVQLEDDGQFECQMLRPEEGPIRASAHLNVIVPPTSIFFSNYQSGSSIDVNENTSLNISCVAPNVKPEPKITWYMNGKRIEDGIKNSVNYNLNKTANSYANLEIHPRRGDHHKILTCEVFHEESNTRLRTNMTLNVFLQLADSVVSTRQHTQTQGGKPLSEPRSEPRTSCASRCKMASANGNRLAKVKVLNGDMFVRAGDNVTMSCTVTGGNPTPNVSWFLGDKLIDSRFVFDATTQESRNIYSLIAGPNDNLANYECRTYNRIGMEPIRKSVRIEVAYAPPGVEMFGEVNIRQGAVANVQCRSLPSNPASQISWLVNGHPVATTVQNEYSKDHGKTSISNLTINSNEINVGKHQISVECTARNIEGSSSKQHIIKILAPPLAPRITGLDELYYFEGDTVNVTCEAHGGNPLAELSWYRGYEKTTMKGKRKPKWAKIGGARNAVAGDSSVSTLSLRLDRTMNTQRLKCEAMNAALDDPLVDSKQLNVFYAPRRLVIRPPDGSGHHLLVGKQARLLCAAPASNPAPQINWYFYPNGDSNPLIYNGETILNETTREAGYTVENVVTFVPTEAHDGTIVRCVASHSDWKHSINSTYPLNVLYPPRMLVDNPVSIVVAEGESFRENLTVKGNPAVSAWQWRKNGVPFDHTIGKVFARGAALSGKNLKSTDAGIYTMVATNSVGNTNISIKLTVEYGARITSISSPIIASDGDTVLLECEADGEPKRADMVQWWRNGAQMESIHRGDTRAVLRLNATQKASGEYICRANNGIAAPAEGKAYVLVNSAPRVLILPALAKAAGSLGGVARARCRAQAVPVADFVWDRGGQVIKGNSSKYSMITSQLDYFTFESTLWIKNLVPEDYHKEIRCTAKNNFGMDFNKIPIGPLSPPDTPVTVKMTNSTSNTISIVWEPGFDGGSDQIFEIKYQKYNEDLVHLVNTTHTNLRLSGLSPAKVYEFQVRAINARGFSSDWTRPPLTLATLNEDGVDVAMVQAKKANWGQWLPPIAGFVVLLVLLNVCLGLYVCSRQRKKKLREKTEMVRTAINGGGVRPVQMYGTMMQSDGPGHTRLETDDVPDVSEDDHSVRTMIEVSPNGYMQPIDPCIYERSCLVEYEFDPHYSNNRHGTIGRSSNSTYTNMPYPEPPRDTSIYPDRSLTRRQLGTPNNNNSPQHHLSTFIHPSGVRAGPIHYSQLDGDLV
ncbi:unnamed protein product [Caenorhabditis auriculariae]|uniref:Uncharacterized protein n=1 Tax=Caenorhabditis auriculariae TaxID=2777116 RepID=A0A8S1H2Y9_9PELO|nr:unnamed protein product [Caenorhabditis auriculariae]